MGTSRGRRACHSRDGALRAAPGEVAGRGMPRRAPRPCELRPRRAGATPRLDRESAQGAALRRACRRQG
jgi:hypothetical protein